MGEIVTTEQNRQHLKRWLQAQKAVVERDLPPALKHNVRKLQGGFFQCATADRATLEAVVNFPDKAKGALLVAASMGWTMGRTMQSDCHLLAFYDKHSKAKVPTLIPNYRGLLRLAYQSPEVSSVTSEAVFQGDEFEYSMGTEPKVVHRKATRDRGQVTHAYAVVHLSRGGPPIVCVLTREEIDKVREAAPGKAAMAWSHWYEEQARKTAVKRALKTAPRTEELARAIDLDDRASAGLPQDLEDREVILDVDAEERTEAEEVPDEKPKPAAKKTTTRKTGNGNGSRANGERRGKEYVSPKQSGLLWARCKARAEALGIDTDDVVSALLGAFDIEDDPEKGRPTTMMAKWQHMDEMLDWIENYEAATQGAESEQGDIAL